MHLKDLSRPSTQTIITYLHHLHYPNDLHCFLYKMLGPNIYVSRAIDDGTHGWYVENVGQTVPLASCFSGSDWLV
jgi:hypothetical protein